MLNKIKSNNILFIITTIGLILLGIYLRGRYYISNPPFWLDEAMYGLSFSPPNNIFRLFIELKEYQLAPPFFSVLTLIMVKLFGFKEMVFRFIPFLSGILSLFAFTFLINKTIKNKFAIIVGIFLFAVNIPLVYYSGEFKCYSTDVLVCILLLIAYNYINIKELTNKKIVLYSLIALSLVLFSFPTMFIIPAMVISKFIEEKKITYKAFWIIFGVAISCGLIYFVNHTHIYPFMLNYWSTKIPGFLELNFDSFKNMINDFFQFWTQRQSQLIVFNIFFVIAGLVRLFIENIKESVLYSFIFLFVLLASLFKIYPCYGRLILFLIPVIILLISSAIDIKKKNYFDRYRMYFDVFYNAYKISALLSSTTEFTNRK